MRVFALLFCATLFCRSVAAQERAFVLGSVETHMEDVSAQVEVYFQSMMLNRASNVWNVDLVARNRGSDPLRTPLLVSVEAFSGTTGPVQPDGTNQSKAFYELKGLNGALMPNTTAPLRKIVLGRSAGTPQITTKVFAPVRPPMAEALALARTVNEAGQPLERVTILESGPAGDRVLATDSRIGFATVGQSAGVHRWKFEKEGFLPSWRMMTLLSNSVLVLPSPRLTQRNERSEVFSPLIGGLVEEAGIRIEFRPGVFAQPSRVTLTPLNGQSLPGFLPLGWSPMQAFWLESEGMMLLPAEVTVTPWGFLFSGETVALAQWDARQAEWRVVQIGAGAGTNAVRFEVSGPGAYALVAADVGGLAPPPPSIGGTLRGSGPSFSNYGVLRAGGRVDPAVGLATKSPHAATALATVNITNSGGALSSGLLLRTEVAEQYRLQDGTERRPPTYESFIIGYQRPGEQQSSALAARFPVRPQFLLGPDELIEATLNIDIVPPGVFSGAVLTTNGGFLATDFIRLSAAPGTVTNAQAAELRPLNITNFMALAGSNTVLAAFELRMGGLGEGRRLAVTAANQPAEESLLIARVLMHDSGVALEPIERLGSTGSLEPSSGERLPGINGPGQYLLLRVHEPHGMITGIVRNAAREPRAGLLVQLSGQPWATLTDTRGYYALLGTIGTNTLTATDPSSGDAGSQEAIMTSVAAGLRLDLDAAPTGPRVAATSPFDGALSVPRNTAITVRFTEALQPETFRSDSITLEDTNGVRVAGALNLNLNGTVATFLPGALLAPASDYVLRISTNLADSSGRTLEGNASFRFKTASDALNRAGAQLISYEPTNGVAPIYGTPGTADSESPVILVNQTSGRTATILSRVDGSFTNSIEADVDDVIEAVIVNRNGSRTTIPVSRQIFRDGSIGLFKGGGILEAESDGGGVMKVLVEPGAIPNKTKFKMEPLSLAQVLTAARGTPPEQGKLLGGMQISTSGDELRQSADAVFPVNVEDMGLPPGVKPEDASFLLVAIQQVDGVTAYEILDKMEYEDGNLVTHSFPFPGLLALAVGQLIVSPLLHSPSLAMTVSGNTYTGQFIVGSSTNVVPGTRRALGGAMVTLFTGAPGFNRPGRLSPGGLFARSDRTGFYAFRIPVNAFDASDGVVTLKATHSKFPGVSALKTAALPPAVGERFGIGNIIGGVNIPFKQVGNVFNDKISPLINAAHTPERPPVAGTASLRVLATDNGSRPTLTVDVDSVVSLMPGRSLSRFDATNSLVLEEDAGPFGKRRVCEVICGYPAVVNLLVTATDGSGNQREMIYPVAFGGAPAPVTNAITAPDRNDRTGPVVIFSNPSLGSGSIGLREPILIKFDEPINSSILSDPSAIRISPALKTPIVRLSEDQRELSLTYFDFAPGIEYTLTVNSLVKDLLGNSLDQDPNTSQADSFSLTFRTAEMRKGDLVSMRQGGGVVTKGIYAYALDRNGTQNGLLNVYDLSNPTNVTKVGELALPEYPRDLALIPGYAYKRRDGGPTLTNDMLAVVGGDLQFGLVGGTDDVGTIAGKGQYLWLIDISNPHQPARITSTLLTRDPVAVVPRVLWDPPYLAYLESSTEQQVVHLVNLQTFILPEFMSREEFEGMGIGRPGLDLNGDGDYVDLGEEIPLPSRVAPEFAGKEISYLVDETDQPINDFAIADRGQFLGVVLGKGKVLDSSGHPTATTAWPAYRTMRNGSLFLDWEEASLTISNYTPVRITAMLRTPVLVSNQIQVLQLVAVSLRPDAGGTNQVAILDVSDPMDPKLLDSIPIPPEHGDLVFALSQRDDGMLVLATSKDLLLIDPARILEKSPTPPQGSATPPGHPALVGTISDGGAGARTFASTAAGFHLMNLGGKHQLIQSAPALQFVQFTEDGRTNALDPSTLTNKSETELLAQMEHARFEPALRLARAHTVTNGTNVAKSELSPPSPSAHHYVLIQAPGSAGPEIKLTLESLNWAGYPMKKKGFLFPPVHAVSTNALAALGQLPVNCDPDVDYAQAFRLSTNKTSPFYNVYLSRPFVLLAEEMPASAISSNDAVLKRKYLWSGSYLRASIDPAMSNNPAVGPFASLVDDDEKVLRPGASVIAVSLPADYIMGPNPDPLRGGVKVYSTLGTVGAHNAEATIKTTDMVLPGRRMPLEFTRMSSGQSLFEGPFGRGWDFNFNQRIVELREFVFIPGSKLPVVLRDTAAESEEGESRDLFFITGAGRVLVYKHAGTTAPSEYAGDPLVQELGWNDSGTVARYYMPPPGTFNMMVKFHSGQYARLEPDGMQYWYNAEGRLQKVYDKYDKNSLELFYNDRGDLVQIRDELLRDVKIGYWRPPTDARRLPQDRTTNSPAAHGKICRIEDYSGRDVLFFYNSEGLLERREGPDVQTVGDPASFKGRQKTTYLYGDCDPLKSTKSVRGAVIGALNGTPMASATAVGGQGRETVQTLALAGTNVTVSLGQANTARAIANDNGTSKITSQDSSVTDYTFDKHGRVKKMDLIGSPGSAQTTSTEYYTNGLVKKVTYPEGNTMDYLYDSANSNLRSRGNILSVTKKPGPRGGVPAQVTATTSYDSKYNEPISRTDFNGKTATITLTGDKRDAQSIAFGGESESFSVNTYGQITKHTAIDGVVKEWTYDSATGFPTETKVGGFTTTFQYGGDSGKRGLPSGSSDPNGNLTTMVFDERNELVMSSRAGSSVTYRFDENGRCTGLTVTPEAGKVLLEEREYNNSGFMTVKRVKQVEVDGSAEDLTTTFEPDSMNRVKKATLPNGAVHELRYDHLGQMIEYKKSGGGASPYIEGYGYNKNGGRTNTVIGGLSETYTYDGYDRVTKVALRNGGTIDHTYDGNGNLLSRIVKDPGGQVLSEVAYTLDDLNRYRTFKKQRDSGSVTVKYDYDSSARKLTVTDAMNVVAETFYDTAGRVTGEKTPLIQRQNTHDSNGNLLSRDVSENGKTFTAKFGYNALDQVISATDSAGNAARYVPQYDGRITEKYDRENNRTQVGYTLLREESSVSNPNGVTRTQEYDRARHLNSIKDSANHETGNSYDTMGRLVETKLPNGQKTTYSSFDDRNSLPQQVVYPRGISASLVYDADGKVLSRTLSGAFGSRAETYAYDALERRTRVSDPSGSIEFSYDKLGFVKEFKHQHASAGIQFSVSQEANNAGYRTKLTYPDGLELNSGRDSPGRLTSLTPSIGAPVIEGVTFATAALVGQRTIGPGLLTLDIQYDNLKRVASKTYTRTADGRRLADTRYVYDKNGAHLARQFVHRAGRLDFFTYDPGYRLTSAHFGARPGLASGEINRSFQPFNPDARISIFLRPGYYAREMAYDNTDVIKSTTLANPDALSIPAFAATYGAPDSLLHITSVDGVFRNGDAAGNTQQAELWVRPPGAKVPEPVLATLEYNELGQLYRIQRQDGVTIVNEYGPQGLRIRRTVTGPVARCIPSDIAYLYDGAHLIEERDLATGESKARYFYADDGDEPIAADVRQGSAIKRFYYMSDVLGSILGVVDETGRTVERAFYDAWGQPILQAEDANPPRISRVIADGNDLLIEFTETVLPSFASPIPAGLVSALKNPASFFTVRTNGIMTGGTVTYEEDLPGHVFGSVFRFRPNAPLKRPIEISVAAASVQDEWNNPNPAETLNLYPDNSTAPYSGPPPGSTASTDLGRSGIESPFLFQGHFFDYDSGLLYCRARFYDPFTGVFLQRDPAGYIDSVNQYAGFANNPVCFRDPTGTAVYEKGQRIQAEGEEAWTMATDAWSYAAAGMKIWIGSALQIGTGAAEGVELMQHDDRSDKMRGAMLILGDFLTASDVFGGAHMFMKGAVGGLGMARRMAGYFDHWLYQPALRDGVRDFLYRKGFTHMEIDAIGYAMKKHGVIQMSIRSFGAKAANRRAGVEAGFLQKPMAVKAKTGSSALLASKHPPGIFVSDADIMHVEIRGAIADEDQVRAFYKSANEHYARAWSAVRSGVPNPPFQHGAHVNTAQLAGKKVGDSVITPGYVNKMGHPGESISIGVAENGNIVARDTPQWKTHGLMEWMREEWSRAVDSVGYPGTPFPIGAKDREFMKYAEELKLPLVHGTRIQFKPIDLSE